MKLKLINKILSRLIIVLAIKFSGRLYALTLNVFSGFKVSYRYKSGKYFVTEGSYQHYFLKHRGTRYLKGLAKCGDKVALSYGLEEIEIQKSDLIVDVGANNGDLLLYLSKFLGCSYVGFEPSPTEFELLSLNSREKTVYNLAVADQNGVIPFYISSFGADSSIYEPPNTDELILAESVRLDNWFDEFSKIKILKIDAEGAEYEVVKGAEKILKQIEYISVDLGFEKGVEQKTTAPEVINFLVANNFSILKYTKRNCFLFHNKKYQIKA